MMRLINALTNRPGALRDREQGKRVFVLANGPSVNAENLALLRDETVISMNASTLLEGKFGFQSKYYVLSDARFINAPEKRAWATSDLSPSTHRVVRSDLRPIDEETLESRTTYVAPLTRDGFSLNLSRGYYFGCTTTMLALQLAWHLGAKDVYLLGCDLRYPEENPRFYAEKTPQLEDAFTSVQLSNIVNAAKVFESQKRQLINCSARSFLRSYLPYMSFADAVSDKVKKRPRKRPATVQKKIAVHS